MSTEKTIWYREGSVFMKKEKLTPWFPPEIKPVYIGWFHTGYFDRDPTNCVENESTGNWWWDGTVWRFSENDHISKVQDKWWRGILKP